MKESTATSIAKIELKDGSTMQLCLDERGDAKITMHAVSDLIQSGMVRDGYIEGGPHEPSIPIALIARMFGPITIQ